MLAAVQEVFSEVIGWVASVFVALNGGAWANLLPLFAIGIAISAVLLGIKIIRSVVWGA